MRPLAIVPCHWCGRDDLARLSHTPWLRLCPHCGGSTYIVDGWDDAERSAAYPPDDTGDPRFSLNRPVAP